jgi:hypothetical protein
MGRNKKTQDDTYKPHFIKFMAWRIGKADNYYSLSHEFSQEDLLAVTPEDVVGYMSLKAYGRRDPGRYDRPDRCRSTTLQQYKKAISYYMPNR